ncbi:4-hydroxylaminobenzoate lyase [Actinacidiphila glaucinigra]
MDHERELMERSIPFLDAVRNRTPGKELEDWLNATHGPHSELYGHLSHLIKRGVEEGWAANIEVDGPNYRRSLIAPPSAETRYFSITAVYMNSQARFRGQYHAHPYGEINLVAPVDPDAQLAGPSGWQGPGWTAPAPGSHHYPEVRGGALIALFYLPAGRISYDVTAPPVD